MVELLKQEFVVSYSVKRLCVYTFLQAASCIDAVSMPTQAVEQTRKVPNMGKTSEQTIMVGEPKRSKSPTLPTLFRRDGYKIVLRRWNNMLKEFRIKSATHALRIS